MKVYDEDIRLQAVARTAMALEREARSHPKNRTLLKALELVLQTMQSVVQADELGLPTAPLIDWAEAALKLAGTTVLVTKSSSDSNVN